MIHFYIHLIYGHKSPKLFHSFFFRIHVFPTNSKFLSNNAARACYEIFHGSMVMVVWYCYEITHASHLNTGSQIRTDAI